MSNIWLGPHEKRLLADCLNVISGAYNDRILWIGHEDGIVASGELIRKTVNLVQTHSLLLAEWHAVRLVNRLNNAAEVDDGVSASEHWYRQEHCRTRTADYCVTPRSGHRTPKASPKASPKEFNRRAAAAMDRLSNPRRGEYIKLVGKFRDFQPDGPSGAKYNWAILGDSKDCGYFVRPVVMGDKGGKTARDSVWVPASSTRRTP